MPLEHAEQRAHDAASALGLHPRTQRLGTRDGLSLWMCTLFDAEGRPVPKGEGGGKGTDAEARVGALFEALEHHVTGPASFDVRQVVFRSGADLAAGPLAGEACAPVLGELPRVACHDYTPLTGPADSSPLPVPLALTTSWYLDRPECRAAAGDEADYRELTRYGTNNGSAIGTTPAEALLHGLNECIERDALSLLLAQCFLADDHRIRVVEPASLPEELATAHRIAEAVVGAPVSLVHATTDIGVPTFFAYTNKAVHSEGRFGGGCSLSPRYAAWRALCELVQLHLGAAAFPERIYPTPTAAFARYPRLRACAEADMSAHLNRAQRINFPGGQGPAADASAQAHTVIDRLAAAGHPPFHRVVASLAGGVTAVRVFVPGLERFMSVLCGFLLVPGPRGRLAVRQSGR
ncbi:YcaO-like family protein [Saccharopolyspora sp. NFXS83]|uniref:YcaO-like family protein n=1 Tax=Saccharopolyspora sp. NFXS83 TaxID=2993560 RepID=UPI00224B8D40|nr:YcaO-like family protein [Saccharopolyspora sp. NFXS83]MCX2729191.1 YcaO-like family protein [Saccharopolyspora sp. NFXS83]